VVAYDNDNKVVAEQVICYGSNVHPKLTADRNIKPDGKDLSFVTVEVLTRRAIYAPQIIYFLM
jgi:hypothetical protein